MQGLRVSREEEPQGTECPVVGQFHGTASTGHQPQVHEGKPQIEAFVILRVLCGSCFSKLTHYRVPGGIATLSQTPYQHWVCGTGGARDRLLLWRTDVPVRGARARRPGDSRQDAGAT